MLKELIIHKNLLDKIEAFGMWGEKPGAALFSQLLDMCGHPEAGQRIIHVAGTNGKGSTVFFVGEILRRLGYNVGCYTSPHFKDACERIVVDNIAISEKKFDSIAEKIIALAETDERYMPTANDIYLAVALLYFKECECDYVIIETGLGGRLDSTNAINEMSPSVVSVITRIGLDHTGILGDNISQIAREKAGIIHEGSKVVIAKMPRGASDEIVSYCKKNNADYILLSEDENISRLVKDFFPDMADTYQGENMANAIATVAFLLGEDRENDIIGTFGDDFPVGPTGRLYRIEGKPYTVIDGAHNPDGVEALVRYLKKISSVTKWVGVCAVMKGKDADRMTELISPLLSEVFITSVGDGRRRTDIDELENCFKKHNIKTTISRDAEAAISEARNTAFWEDRSVVVFGSLMLAGKAVDICREI